MSRKRKAFGCKEDWYVIFIIIFALIMIFPALSSIFGHRCGSRHIARRISCTSNLKQIGLSLKQYAMDYDDFFPPENNSIGLDKLRELDYLTDYGVYTCPNTITTRGSGTDLLIETNCDYVYMGGSKEGENPDIPLAFDKPNNHSNTDKKYPPKLLTKLLKKAKKIDSVLPKK